MLDALQNACRISQIKTVITSRAFVEKAKLGDLISQLATVRVVYLEDLRKQFGMLDKLWLMLWAIRQSTARDAQGAARRSGRHSVYVRI